MTVAIISVVAVLLVLAVGLLIFKLMKKSQSAVPDVADASRAGGERVVGVDQQGRAITEAQEPQTAARDEDAFESLLQDEMHELGRPQPPDEQA